MHFAPRAGSALAAITLALGLAALPTPAYAAPISCDEAALVTAIDAANLAGGGTIGLAPNCVYSLDTVEPAAGGSGPNGLPVITEAITINGSNSVIERSTATGTPKFRLFEVGGTDGELTLNRVSLRNGDPTVDGSEDGGAILVNSGRVLAVKGSTLSGNTAQEGGAIASVAGSSTTISSSVIKGNVVFFGGGGLYNLGGSVTVRSTIVSDNQAHHGSGIHNLGALTLQSSIVRKNIAQAEGGGIYNTATATIRSSSVHGNTADIGGGIFNLVGTTTVNSSIITGNTATVEGGAIYENPGSTVNLANSIALGNTPNNCRPPGTVPGCIN
ncbi:hypothetical protein [Streptomyces sp. NPDC059881]|uniref:hypothetical protein n=1 Tax=Streptomyces sp. NPDC059881 TaxID=3346986 RepID=UPI003651A85F